MSQRRPFNAFSAADRTALKVNGTLATYGFPAATITTALAALDAYSKADTDQNTAIGSATKATADRNAAVKELDAYLKQLKGIAKVALRQRPDLLKKLNA